LHRSSQEGKIMPRKLKVFCMPIGFEDAYVAAPSRKAALEAWGAVHDQFARGVAKEVSDPALMKEPLARPGEVIRKSRGDLARQLKSLPRAKKGAIAKQASPARKSRPKPQPKRDRLDSAEQAVEAARRRQQAEVDKLERQLDILRAKHTRELQQLTRKRDAERKRYSEALKAWSES
jgi:hypothetical protein